MQPVLLQDYVEQLRDLVRGGRHSEAFALGRHILEHFPKHLKTYVLMAQACLETDDLSSATDLYRRVLSSDPENVASLVGMGVISAAREQPEEALWYLTRAFEMQPSNIELRRELAHAREGYSGASTNRVELTPAALARQFIRQGQYAQAVTELRRIIKQEGSRYDLRVALAEALYREGRGDEAGQMAQSILDQAPYSLKPLLILAALYAETDPAESERLLARARELDPDDLAARSLIGGPLSESEPARILPLGAPAAESSQSEQVDIRAQTRHDTKAEPELTDEQTQQAHLLLDSLDESTQISTELADESVEMSFAEPVIDTEGDSITGTKVAVPEEPEESNKTAAAVLLAGSALIAGGDQSSEPVPTVRTHTVIPKVRPIIPGAIAKLPAWLFPRANEVEPASSLHPAPPSREEQIRPLPTRLTEEQQAVDASIVAPPDWEQAEPPPPLTDTEPSAASVATGWSTAEQPPTETEDLALSERLKEKPSKVRMRWDVEALDEETGASRAEQGAQAPAAQPPSKATDSRALLSEARRVRSEGNIAGALELFERAMHRRPSPLDEITSDLEEIAALPDASATAHRLLGEAYAMAGQFKQALEHYRVALNK